MIIGCRLNYTNYDANTGNTHNKKYVENHDEHLSAILISQNETHAISEFKESYSHKLGSDVSIVEALSTAYSKIKLLSPILVRTDAHLR